MKKMGEVQIVIHDGMPYVYDPVTDKFYTMLEDI